MKKKNIVLIIILICLTVIGSLFAYIECKEEEPLEYNAVVLKWGYTSRDIFTSEFNAENDIGATCYNGWHLIITDQETYDKVFFYDYNVDFNTQMIIMSFYMALDESSKRIKSISYSGKTLLITKAREIKYLKSCDGRKDYGTPRPHNLIIKLDKLDITEFKTKVVTERIIW